MVTMTMTSATAVEGSNPGLQFTVTLSEAMAKDMSVDYRPILNGSAEGEDFYGPDIFAGTLTIAAGDTSGTISIRPEDWEYSYGDFRPNEYDEFFTLELYNPTNGVTFPRGAPVLRSTGVILDDKGDPDLSVNVSDPVVVEGDGGERNALFEIRLSRPAPEAVTLKYSTKDGSALAGQDYAAVSGSVNFKSGQTVAYVEVPVYGDSAVEASEDFSLVVVPPDGSEIGIDDAGGIARIMDDDAAKGPVISLQGAAGGEDDGPMRFTVTLSEIAKEDVTFSWRTLFNDTATDGDVDFYYTNNKSEGTLTIAAGEQSTHVFIRGEHSSLDEFDELFSVEIFNPIGATFAGGAQTLVATGYVRDYDGKDTNVALGSAPFSIKEYKFGESAGIHSVPIELSRAAHDTLKFKVTATSGSAVEGKDFKILQDTITFAPGQTLAGVKVKILNDLAIESLETFTLNFTLKSGDDFSGSIVNQTVRIVDTPAFSNRGEILYLTNKRDVVNSLGGDDEIFGRGGNDVIFGDKGRDIIEGGDGDDKLFGGLDNDILYGNNGNDILNGGRGGDRLIGGAGTDTADYSRAGKSVEAYLSRATTNVGEAAGDSYRGVENLNGSKRGDILGGNNGANRIAGGDGADKLLGRLGNDVLIGGNGNDKLFGQDGKDILLGNNGNDALDGGAGLDILNGAAGNDRLVGGEGADQFQFDAGKDHILDFENDVDTIVLDSDLWGGDYTVRRVVDRYGVDHGDYVSLEFSGGNALRIDGVASLNAIVDDIEII